MSTSTVLQEMAVYARLLKRMSGDKRLMATHASLFTALFIQWQRNGFGNPFPATRRELMTHSKIASPATYHKCMRELDDFGYIRYQTLLPSQKGSLVYWPEGLN
jgi:hypothetical protein